MVWVIAQLVHTDFLERPCEKDVHLSIHSKTLDPVSYAIKSLEKLQFESQPGSQGIKLVRMGLFCGTSILQVEQKDTLDATAD